MMRLVAVVFSLMSLFIVVSGCSRVQPVTVSQGGPSMTVPYESLGWAEVERNAPVIEYRRVGGQLLEWCSFGYFPNISHQEYLQGLLDRKLVKAAKERYGAEAVINTQYSPDLSAKNFPKGKIYARGEMVRYKRFTA